MTGGQGEEAERGGRDGRGEHQRDAQRALFDTLRVPLKGSCSIGALNDTCSRSADAANAAQCQAPQENSPADPTQDTADPNPLVRALAIRTMAVLRTEKTLDYLASPLSRCLRDENPYVRKTAALCVAKVFDLKPGLCVEYGFIESLRDLVGDGNPMVCSSLYST